MRPSKDDFWFGLAAQYATRATCPRARIGSVLVKFDRLVGAGFNGAPEREEHCPDTPEHMALDHCDRARHAEINALRNALLPPFGSTIYVVGERRICPDCADKLREAGVERFMWLPSFSTLDSVLTEVVAWQRQTFTYATPASITEHLRREAIELADDPTNLSELADVMLLVAGLASNLGADLTTIVAEKLAINRRRTWGQPDAAGVVEHVR